MKPKNRYIIYARKSTESDERQIQSIDDQLKIMKNLATSLGLNVVDILTESMSAKAPGRKVFNNMIDRVDKGEVNGIITWKLDRLSRNPIDSGKIQYMLQIGKLNKVIANDKEYNLEDAGLLMSVENGMSNQFLLDLSKNVKRGIQSKAEKGWYPGVPTIGYINDLATKTIIKHPDNFDIISKIWKYIITGNYSVNDVLILANNSWGLRTKNGTKLSRSGIYRILNNVFYTGDFSWKGEIMKGKHPAMITYEEFNIVQKFLGKKGKAKLIKHDFSYTGIIKCGCCGSMITAGNKYKIIKSTNAKKEYSYYWCTKKIKSKKQSCNQKAIRKEELEKQIDEYLSCIDILPEFKEWTINILKRDLKNEVEERELNLKRLQQEQLRTRNRLDKLTDMLLEGRITDSIFDFKRGNLELELKELDESILNIDNTRKNKIDYIEDMFNFAATARFAFKNGDNQTKKNIFRKLGLQFELLDGKLAIELHPCLEIIKKSRYIVTDRIHRFAPIKNSTSSGRTNTIKGKCLIWQGP